jgi:hypothetical protein
VLGSGELRIFACLGATAGTIVFGGVLRYEKFEDDSSISTILYPPSQLNRQNPLGLKPWPTSVLNQSGVLPSAGFLEDSLHTTWDGADQPISYEIIDVEDSFWEGNDGQWIDKGVFTDGDDKRQVTIAGHAQDLQDIDAEQWPEIIADPGWAKYQAAQRTNVDREMIYRTEDVSDSGRRAACT